MQSRLVDALRNFVGRLMRTVAPFPGLRTMGVAAALLLIVAGGSGTKLVLNSMNELPANAVFRANGHVFTKDQLQQRMKMMELLYGLQPPRDPKQLGNFNRTVAKALAVSDIVDDTARERGIVIANKAASDQLDNLLKNNGGQDRHAFLQQLGQQGISEQQVLDEIKRQQENARLFGQVTGSVKPVTDQAARDYFDKNRAQMVSPEQRDLSNIVLPSQEQANDVAHQATSGADFGSLAKQYSIDGSTKDNGGEMGTVSADQLDAGYARAAFQAPGGAVFGPVHTPQGWNVGKVNKVVPAVPLRFDQVQDAIKTKLVNQMKLRQWDAFLVNRIKEADVSYAPEYQPADPDAPPASPGNS